MYNVFTVIRSWVVSKIAIDRTASFYTESVLLTSGLISAVGGVSTLQKKLGTEVMSAEKHNLKEFADLDTFQNGVLKLLGWGLSLIARCKCNLICYFFSSL